MRVRKTVEIPLASAEGAKAPGQWNRLRVTMRGQQMTARLNDKVFQDKTLSGAPPEGVFGLEHTGTPIQLENIYVRELK